MARDNYVDLNILDLSISAIFLVLYAIFLNINFLLFSRAQLLDLINNTNFTENSPDLTETPKIASTLYVIATTVFVVITWYEIALAENDEDATRQQVQNTYDNFVGVYLILYGSIINYFVAQKK